MTENKSNSNAPEPSEEKVGLGWLIIAFVLNVLFWQPMKYMINHAYHQATLVRAITYSCFGAVVSIAAGVCVSYQLGWQHDFSLLGWLPAGIGATVATFVYAWCPLLIWVYRPLEKCSNWLWERVRINSDSKYKPFKPAKPGNLPPDATTPVEEEKPLTHLTWFTQLLLGLLYLAGVAGFAYLGWSLTHDYLNAGAAWMPWAVWSIVGLIAFCITQSGRSSWDGFYGRMQAFAVGSAILAIYASADWIGQLGIGGWAWAIYLAQFVLYYGLLFPALHTFISECFYWVYKGVDKLDSTTYSENDRKYRDFFGQCVNITLALLVAKMAFQLFALLAWPLWSLLLLAALAALLSYIFIGEILAGGAGLAVFASSCHLIGYGWYYRADLHQLSGLQVSDGVWNGIICAAIATAVVLNFLLFLPLAYVAGRFLSRDLFKFAHKVGELLSLAHKAIDKKVQNALSKLGRAYAETYRPKPQDASDKIYREMFVQVVNVLQTLVLTVAATLAVYHAQSGLLGLVLAALSAVLAAYSLYVVGGKILIESGVKLVGGLVAFAAGVSFGAYIHLSAISNYGWLMGLVTYGLTYRLLFPAFYLSLAWIANRGSLPQVLKDRLAAVHDRAWAKFTAAWTAAAGVVAAISAKIAAAWRKITHKN